MVKQELKQLQAVLLITEILLCNEFHPPCAGLFLLKACCVFSHYYTADRQYSALKCMIKLCYTRPCISVSRIRQCKDWPYSRLVPLASTSQCLHVCFSLKADISICVSPLSARSGRLQNLDKFELLKDKFHFLRISAFTFKITFMTFLPVLQT